MATSASILTIRSSVLLKLCISVISFVKPLSCPALSERMPSSSGLPFSKKDKGGLPTHRLPTRDPRLHKFDEWLDGPATILPPTLMSLFPKNWDLEADGPCYMLAGNWLDGTETSFITEYNVQLVIRAAGD